MNKYVIRVKSKKEDGFNFIHELINNHSGVVLEAAIGQSAWFAYKLEDDNLCPWHRVNTSNVESITEEAGNIEIVTENTIYSFTLV